MYVIFSLHQDGDSYLKYLVDRIDLQPKLIQEYCQVYPDKIIVFNDKTYFNGDVVSSQCQRYLSSLCPKILIDSCAIDKVKSKYYVDDFDVNGETWPYIYIYGDVYFIFETDGSPESLKTFNCLITGYGSF